MEGPSQDRSRRSGSRTPPASASPLLPSGINSTFELEKRGRALSSTPQNSTPNSSSSRHSESSPKTTKSHANPSDNFARAPNFFQRLSQKFFRARDEGMEPRTPSEDATAAVITASAPVRGHVVGYGSESLRSQATATTAATTPAMSTASRSRALSSTVVARSDAVKAAIEGKHTRSSFSASVRSNAIYRESYGVDADTRKYRRELWSSPASGRFTDSCLGGSRADAPDVQYQQSEKRMKAASFDATRETAKPACVSVATPIASGTTATATSRTPTNPVPDMTPSPLTTLKAMRPLDPMTPPSGTPTPFPSSNKIQTALTKPPKEAEKDQTNSSSQWAPQQHTEPAAAAANEIVCSNLPFGCLDGALKRGLLVKGADVTLGTFLTQRSIEIIPRRLYWISISEGGTSLLGNGGSNLYLFCIDDQLVYEPFFADFGPLNLGQTYRYCEKLVNLLLEPSLASNVIVHYCSNDEHKRANSAYLMVAFCVIIMRWSAEAAVSKFESLKPPIVPFRDATYGLCYYNLSLRHCACALVRAISLGWFDFDTFDIASYEHYEKLENGDLSWIIPNKFLAFSAPEPRRSDNDQFVCFSPEDYVSIFKRLGVKIVIRLNKRQYDRRFFLNNGIQHVDLYFLDGSCPSSEILNRFFEVTEKCQDGAIAVHCKAGLGRTGTLIGCYAIKHYGFTGAEWIAWNRICRPGSVLGPQQDFLREIESELRFTGTRTTSQTTTTKATSPDLEYLLRKMTLEEKTTALKGDLDQGKRLVDTKRQAHHLPSPTSG